MCANFNINRLRGKGGARNPRIILRLNKKYFSKKKHRFSFFRIFLQQLLCLVASFKKLNSFSKFKAKMIIIKNRIARAK